MDLTVEVANRGHSSAPRPPLAPELGSNTFFGRFVLLDVLGRGGAATVYGAYDQALRRQVALKLLRQGSSEGFEDLDLVREAQAMARLSHPNVVAVYDVVMEGDALALAMEHVNGTTLKSWLDARRLAWREVLRVFLQAGEGLAAAHRADLVHRDFKATNVMVSDDGRILVTDFGIAQEQPVMNDRSGATEGVTGEYPGELEQDQTITGTPSHMAPEQHRHGVVDARCDQYAFCVALWTALCGVRPFTDKSLSALERSKVSGPPPWPKHVRVPSVVSAAICRGLAPNADERWPAMPDLLQALRRGTRDAQKQWGAVALVLPVAGAWLWTWHGERAQRCSGADGLLRETQNAERRESLHESFVATKLSYAADTAVRVQAELDEYTREWTQQYRSACEATVLEKTQPEAVMDLRLSCLQRRRVEVEATLRVLVHADARVVEHAVDMAAALPPLSQCEDVDALAAEVPPPDNADEAQRVERARAALADASVQLFAGRIDDVSKSIEAAALAVQDVHYPPVRAELSLMRGKLFHHRNDYPRSEQALRQALSSALETGMTAAAAASASALAVLVGERQARMAEGMRLATMAVALSRAQGSDLSTQANAVSSLAVVLGTQARFEEAETALREALVLREKALGPEHPKTARDHHNLAVALAYLGRHAEAEVGYRVALERRRKAFGAEHPDVASCRNGLGLALRDQGRLQEAEVELREALRVRAQAFGPQHALVAQSHQNLAVVLDALGRHAEAEAQLVRAVATYEEVLGPEHPKVALPRQLLGGVMLQQGRFEEAETILHEALRVHEKFYGPQHPKVADCRLDIGSLALKLGRVEHAEEQFRHALGAYETSVGLEHPWTGEALRKLGSLLYDAERVDEARDVLERAWSIVSRRTAAEPRAAVAFHLARALWRTRVDRPRALDLARRAVTDFTQIGERGHERRVEVEQWLSRVGEP